MRARLVAAIALSAQALLSGQSSAIIVAADLGTHLDPIARFDGSTWRTIAPAGLERVAPRDWLRWHASGAPSRIRLQVGKPSGRCAVPRKLPVTSPATSPPGMFDRTYVGTAVTGAIQVDGLRRVTDSSLEGKPLVDTIGPLFERRARAHGVSPTLLARAKMSVDWIFSPVSSDASSVYYFEASKRIPDAGGTPSEDPKGDVRVEVSGWLRAIDGEFVPVGSKSELSWGPEATSPRPTLLPLGVLRQGEGRIWVMKGHLGARDTFTLYQLQPSAIRTLLTVDAAIC